MAYASSVEKIVDTYFHALTKEPFVHYNKRFRGGKKEYYPKILNVAPHFFMEYKCVLNCAGCCASFFSLDYLPEEKRPSKIEFTQKTFNINGVEVPYYSAPNKKSDFSTHCDQVEQATGKCLIHEESPFSCDFEPLRFVHHRDHTWLGTRTFGRGWAMMRVDSERGALCEFSKEKTLEARDIAVRKLERLKMFTDAAELDTWIPEIIEWANKGISSFPLILSK